jgi:hypothetical protein
MDSHPPQVITNPCEPPAPVGTYYLTIIVQSPCGETVSLGHSVGGDCENPLFPTSTRVNDITKARSPVTGRPRFLCV